MSDDSTPHPHVPTMQEWTAAIRALNTAVPAQDTARQEQDRVPQVRVLADTEWAGVVAAVRSELGARQCLFGPVMTTRLAELLGVFGIALPGADRHLAGLSLPSPPCTDADLHQAYAGALRTLRAAFGVPMLQPQAPCGVLDRILAAVDVQMPSGTLPLHLLQDMLDYPMDRPGLARPGMHGLQG
ncbi:hypothetical protein ACJ6WF_47955 [Streptomyces sp. MMS24-I2-30]|uniref:hypothetical protein n=1 Tax=Streptomyces sp. MMS24-I2-30 TaxID=3351564 RepID=UPI003896DD79